MKNLSKYSVLALTAVFFVSCGNAQKGKEEAKVSSAVVETDSLSKEAAQMGKEEFEMQACDFGQLTEGAQVIHTFILQNTGDAPVILSKVTASCGCTQTEF